MILLNSKSALQMHNTYIDENKNKIVFVFSFKILLNFSVLYTAHVQIILHSDHQITCVFFVFVFFNLKRPCFKCLLK